MGPKALIAATAVAGFAARRVRAYAREHGKTVGEVLGDLPARLSEDLATLPDDLRMALREGRLAADRRARELDEKLDAL